MVQILENNKRPSFSEQINTGINAAMPGIQQFMQQREMQQKKQQQMKAAERLGIDQSVLQLPEQAQAEYFKNAFAKEKPLNPLQQAKLEALQQNQGLFKQLSMKLEGNQPDQNQDQMQPPQQQSPQEEIKKGFANVPDELLHEVAAFKGQPGEQGIFGNIAQDEIDRRIKEKKLNREEFREERAFNSKYVEEAEKKVNVLRESVPKKEFALNLARDAVESGDMSFFSKDKLADIFGEVFRTAKGSQLTTALKENLLSNMSRVSAKAQNIWFEKRLNSMAPEIGRSKEANLTTQEIIEGELAMDRAYLETFDKVSEEDEKKYGFVKKDVEKRSRDLVKPLNKEILGRTTYRVKELEEEEKGVNKLKLEVGKNVERGTPLTLAMANLYKEKFGKDALTIAKKNGYTIPTLEEFKIYQQRPQEFREDLSQ